MCVLAAPKTRVFRIVQPRATRQESLASLRSALEEAVEMNRKNLGIPKP